MPSRRLCHVRVKSYTLNHRVVVHVCAEACWHTELILCADSILVTVAESSWDLFSPLSFSACFSFHSVLMNWAIFCPRKNTSQRYNTVLNPDDSKRHLRNKHQSSDHLKNNVYLRTEPNKNSTQSYYLLRRLTHAHWMKTRQTSPLFLWLWYSAFLLTYKVIRPKDEEKQPQLLSHMFLFSALWGKTAADLITAMP